MNRAQEVSNIIKENQGSVYTKQVYKQATGQSIYIMKDGEPVGLITWSIEKYFSGIPWRTSVTAHGPDYVAEKESPENAVRDYYVKSKDYYDADTDGGKTRPRYWRTKPEASRAKNKYMKDAISWLENRLGISNIKRLKKV